MSADAATTADITDLILLEHEEFRRRFASLWVMRGEDNFAARAVAWRMLVNLLEVHASAEEEIHYPALLTRGGDHAQAETADAIGDHNQIRGAIKTAGRVSSGTDFWWAAVLACRQANDEHLAEEERDVIPDIREHVDAALRLELGGRWQEFHTVHQAARGISIEDVDPTAFVAENS